MGAGTTDVSIVRSTPHGFVVDAALGLDLGGLDVEAAVFAHVGQSVAGRDRAGWTSLATADDPAARRARQALRAEVREAKEVLSRASTAYVRVLGDEVPLTRDELTALARPLLAPAVDLLESGLRRAGVAPADLAGVFLVGGASRMPLVAHLVHERLGRAPLVLEQPETVVARGALVAASMRAVRFERRVAMRVDARERTREPDVAGPARSASTNTTDQPEAARRRPTRVALAALGILLLLVALGGDRGRVGAVRPPGTDRLAATPNLCPVKLGFLASFSDVWAGWEPADLFAGARLAVLLHNDRRPGCAVGIDDLDSGRNLDLAASQATTVAQDPAYVGLIGPMFDSEVATAMPVLDAAGVPVITPFDTAGTRAARAWRTYHRMLGDQVAGAAAAARYLRAMPGAPRVFVLDDHLVSGRQPVVDAVTAGLGDRLAGRFTVENHSRFIDTVANRIRSSGATVVYFCLGDYDYAGALSAQLAATGGGVTLVADTSVKQQALDRRARTVDGLRFVAPDIPVASTDPAFRDAYHERYGYEPGPYAAEAFDATTILLDGIDAGHTTREALLAYVDGYRGTGVTGALRFDNGTRADPRWWAYRAEGGAVVPDREIP